MLTRFLFLCFWRVFLVGQTLGRVLTDAFWKNRFPLPQVSGAYLIGDITFFFLISLLSVSLFFTISNITYMQIIPMQLYQLFYSTNSLQYNSDFVISFSDNPPTAILEWCLFFQFNTCPFLQFLCPLPSSTPPLRPQVTPSTEAYSLKRNKQTNKQIQSQKSCPKLKLILYL